MCGRRNIREKSMPRKLTTAEFITKAKKVHKGKYDYSLVDYVNAKTKVKIMCAVHGIFEPTPNDHLSRCGCPKCAPCAKLTTEIFVQRSIKVHGDVYNYNLVKYITKNITVQIICRKHGSFWQYPENHLKGSGCSKCNADRLRYTTEEFIKRSVAAHGTKYRYDKVNYVNNTTKVKLICPTHGVFIQDPANHLRGRGCPECISSESKGVGIIKAHLQNTEYKQEYRLLGCKNKQVLPFDFGVLHKGDLAGLIEFDGRQHYVPVKFYGGFKQLRRTQLHDLMKTLYCEANNIPLLRIPYWRQHEIPKLINNFIAENQLVLHVKRTIKIV